jgi:poly-gamma-glutamate synthesis protein (capsule biosynthesis protein)
MRSATRLAGACVAVTVLLLSAACLVRGPGAPPAAAPIVTPSVHSAQPTPTTPAPARTVTILGAGDVLLHSPVWRQAAADAAAAGRSGYDFRPMFANVAPHIAAADVAICHLETPVGPPDGPFSGYPLFSVPPQIVTALRHSGFDSCSTASNHTLDAGQAGVYRTLDALDAAGLRHAGSYRSASEQRTPTVLDVEGVWVAHLSYTSGFNGLRRPAGKAWIANLIDPDAILAEARRARSAGAGIVVVSLHWGIEYDHRANPSQVSLARRLLAAPEIDLILGGHAHVVQPLEKINGKWVAYGMGNQIARQSDAHPARHEGVMPRFTFTEQAPGHWVVTTVEAIATWIDVTPRIRIVDLAAAIADPSTSSARRHTYLAAYRRITGYLQSRGAQVSLAAP